MQLASRILCLTLAVVCLGLLAQPASAESYITYEPVPTPNRYFVFFSEVGGFSGGTVGYSYESTVYGINIAGAVSTDGSPGGVVLTPEGPISLPFDPNGREFFGIGVWTQDFGEGTFDHTILSALPGSTVNPLSLTLEEFLSGQTGNMGGLDGGFATPGMVVMTSEGALADHYFDDEDETGRLEDILDPETGEIMWPTTSVFSANSGEEDVFIFPNTIPQIGTFSFTFNPNDQSFGSTFTPVPEPGLACLAFLAVGTVLVRRRRRK